MTANDALNPVFEALVQATAATILNPVFAAESMTGFNRHRVSALSPDQVREVPKKYRLQ